mgnify:CR=1 FL=1
MHINSEAEYDPPRHVQALNPLPFGLHFSIDSVYPGRRSEFPWPNIWPVFYGYSLITDIQFAAIPVLLGEPATKYPPVMLHRWQQEAELRKAGFTSEQIQASIRIAAVVNAVARVLEAEKAAG